MKKIIHIINSLGDGGAERNLYNLVCEDRKNNRIIIISAIDNLIKGGSGQAVQNMNVAFKLKETMGLT